MTEINFSIATKPSLREIGRRLNARTIKSNDLVYFEITFGEFTLPEWVQDIRQTCLELVANKELANLKKLAHFVLCMEPLFETTYKDDYIICEFTDDIKFTVSLFEFCNELDRVVVEILQGSGNYAFMNREIKKELLLFRRQPYYRLFM